MRTAILLTALLCCQIGRSADTIVTTTVTITTAQQDADTMARTGILRHCRRNGGSLEGIGFSATSADGAIKNTCYWNSGRKPRDIGVARGARGWFAVVRYW